ncbi:MAG: S1 RNA-binding domain-containing protein, partial [Bacteroidota bacterium]|nr:S1 RNA-binding domain-containing protein [Bacteroidota bacterium]
RREIGHGNLALRALKKMIPDEFPYVIRVVSDILESNGSSSMATVCAGTMCMLDAGVKMKRPVSGIAMGLITDPANNKFAVLSDILGDEDHLGDMDFKVTGTSKGITATQMDIKVGGLSYEILTQALLQAKQGREHILGEILKVISEPREDYKPNVPRVEVVQVPKEMIGPIIGPGGKNIQKLQEETKTVISIEERDDIGYVQISSVNKESLDAAVRRIKLIIAIPEKGEIYKGKVKSITSFGAFVEIMPGKEGLLHISEISWNRLQTVEEELTEGQEIEVKLLDMDRDGKMKLSRRVLLPKPEGMPDRPERSNDDRPPRRDDNRGGGDRGGDRRDNRGGDRRDNRDRR